MYQDNQNKTLRARTIPGTSRIPLENQNKTLRARTIPGTSRIYLENQNNTRIRGIWNTRIIPGEILAAPHSSL